MASKLTQQHRAQMEEILSPNDPTHFNTLISQLMSNNNDQRSQAESLYNLCKTYQPDSLSLKLAQLLQSSPYPEARTMGAVLSRKFLTRDDSLVYPKLAGSTQAWLKSIMLSCIQTEDTKTISTKLCDTISEFAATIVPDNQWPELLPFMFNCVTSDNPKLRENSLLIFAQLAMTRMVGNYDLQLKNRVKSMTKKVIRDSGSEINWKIGKIGRDWGKLSDRDLGFCLAMRKWRRERSNLGIKMTRFNRPYQYWIALQP